MEVVICEGAKLKFGHARARTLTLDDGSVVTAGTRVVKIPAAKVDQRLLDDFKSHGVITKLKVGDTITGFELCIGGPDVAKKGVGPGYIKLAGLDTFFYCALGGDPNWMNPLELQVTLAPLLGPDNMQLDPVEASCKSISFVCSLLIISFVLTSGILYAT